ncbi:hypothetical protein KORDIASMS9_01022 [Kordia sp. SMS9]|uniref:hypothetical protein n=1 Tax=Kordia sp. SMS9 TaxID=2282170 RepID=UPI000E0D4D52|nr:hypothetical protein [Kordia sp. SMS9]AXG68806.1 hypothetical protein KORDIASMS9_01022 [Kordia sp. SMS9]
MKKKNLKNLNLSKISISNLHATKRGAIVSCSVVECGQSDTTITTIPHPADSGTCNTMQHPGCSDNTLAADCESLGYCPDTFWCRTVA